MPNHKEKESFIRIEDGWGNPAWINERWIMMVVPNMDYSEPYVTSIMMTNGMRLPIYKLPAEREEWGRK